MQLHDHHQQNVGTVVTARHCAVVNHVNTTNYVFIFLKLFYQSSNVYTGMNFRRHRCR